MKKSISIWVIYCAIVSTVLMVCLSSCSTSKRCERHLKRCKDLGCLTTTADTVFSYDTIKGFSKDTVFRFTDSSAVDTVWIVSNGVKVKTVIRWHDRIVEQSITKKDTVIKTLQITKYKNFEVEVKKTPWYVWLIIALMGITILYQVFKK